MQRAYLVAVGCVRMETPDRFTEVLLAEDKGWSTNKVAALWENSVNSPVDLDHKIPVHLTYFTTVVHDTGKVATLPDIYGLDGKLGKALFGDAAATPFSSAKSTREEAAVSSPMKPKSVGPAIGTSWTDCESYLVWQRTSWEPHRVGRDIQPRRAHCST